MTIDDLWRIAYFTGKAVTLDVGGGHDTVYYVIHDGRTYTIPDDEAELLAVIS